MFPDIDRVEIFSNKAAEEMPIEFYEELNGGISLSSETKLHPKSFPHRPVYIMGQYKRDILGNSIEIFYGSFREVFSCLSEKEIFEELKKVLSHEFRHHIEMRAGVCDLILLDESELKEMGVENG